MQAVPRRLITSALAGWWRRLRNGTYESVLRPGEFADGTGSATVLKHAGRGRRAASRQRGACGRSAAGSASPCQGEGRGFESRRPLGGAGRRPACRRSARLFGTRGLFLGPHGGMAEWLRQGPAKPCTRVRFPLPPRGRLAQRESASLTRKRSQVQILYRPREAAGHRPVPGSRGLA
jgi:hypothetical protein